jgi:hypothetical protein
MAHQFLSNVKVVPAVEAWDGAIGNITPVEVDGRGFDRAAYLIQLGTAGAGGKLNAKIQEAATAGGALTDITGAALAEVTKAAGDGKVEVIDVPINPAKPYQKVTGATAAGAFPNAVVCVLYRGSGTFPATQVAVQVVEV